jgi:hypothetical protein
MEKTNSIRQLPWKILIISLIIFSVTFIILLTLALFNVLPFSWGWGWLLGSIIGILNYLLIIVQATRLQISVQQGLKVGANPGYMIGRLGLFAIGLLASVWIKINDAEVFNLFAIFIAYLVISSVIFVTGANFRINKR